MVDYRRAFLSYGHEDADLARTLAVALRNRGVQIWLDEWELRCDLDESTLLESLRGALARAEALIDLRTPATSTRTKAHYGGRPIPRQALIESHVFAKEQYLAYEAHIWTTITRPHVSSFKVIEIRLREEHSARASMILERGVICRPWSGSTYRVRIKAGDRVPNGYIALAPFVTIRPAAYENCIPYVLAELSTTAHDESGECQ